ncbi:MAG: arginine--tRNA ligase [Clostridia bacterium]|nr:arginine--tRNA ligase [Clostridia bacterium]
MKDFKEQIANILTNVIDMDIQELKSIIEIPKDEKMGDYAFPCFRFAKVFGKAPAMIAEELKEKLELSTTDIEKVETAGAYLNFTIKKEALTSEVLKEIADKNENYGKQEIGIGKNVIVEYSSPNIAKPFHIGHLRTTLIGRALYNIYKTLGYNTIGINHLGDYGTQFGKMIEGYKRWGSEYNLEENPIEELTKIYVRINQLCKENEAVLEQCRENFKKLEEGDEYCTSLWKQFRDLSLKEFYRIYDLLDIHFDSLNGEAFYSDKTDEVIDILERTGKLVESEGAKIIDLEEQKMPPCIICKSNGSTIYATRDLAAILYRARTYDFDKCLYVVAYEQNLHFKQIFEVAKLLGIPEKCQKGLEHISYGMVHLKSGKMSTREGNVIKVEELLQEAISRVRTIIEEKNPELTEEEKDDIAKKVGIGAVIYNDLAGSRIKDEIFDWDTILNFNGETGPYIQYTYVRTNSVLKKVGNIPTLSEVDIKQIMDDEAYKVSKLLYSYPEIIRNAAQKNEPSIISKFLIDLAKAYSSFYNENKIIVEDIKVQNARVYLTYITNLVLKNGAHLLGIEMPEKM